MKCFLQLKDEAVEPEIQRGLQDDFGCFHCVTVFDVVRPDRGTAGEESAEYRWQTDSGTRRESITPVVSQGG